jgi:hypothetical protein
MQGAAENRNAALQVWRLKRGSHQNPAVFLASLTVSWQCGA